MIIDVIFIKFHNRNGFVWYPKKKTMCRLGIQQNILFMCEMGGGSHFRGNSNY